MKVIEANTRYSLKQQDRAFIASALAASADEQQLVDGLFDDDNMSDLILDCSKLYDILTDPQRDNDVSRRLYFYVVLRRELRNEEVVDRDIADYLAGVFDTFLNGLEEPDPSSDQFFDKEYVWGLLAAVDSNNHEQNLITRAHIGNYTLFATGVYPERIQYRAEYERGPKPKYYEAIGRASYSTASQLPIADEFAYVDLFKKLAAKFRQIRIALNRLSIRTELAGHREEHDSVLLTE